MTTTRKLASFTVLTALLALSGCFKMTGGGWFIDNEGDLVTIAFTAQPDGEPTGNCDGYIAPFPQVPTCQPAKGRLTLIDHGGASGEPLMMRGNFNGTYNPVSGNLEDGSQFTGTVVIDGEEWIFGMRVSDYGEPGNFEDPDVTGDFFFLMLEPAATADGSPDIVYLGQLGGGNIRVHAK